jgi:hydrogenase maturation protein HypF
VLRAHDVPFPSAEERDLVCQQLDSGVNTPETTSAGRFLDAVSALLGICSERTYEGEPAMRLEAVAADGTPLDIDPPRTTVDGRPALDMPRFLVELADRRADGAARADLAATTQEALALGLGDLAVAAADRRGRDAVALSGGVAYNEHIACRLRERVADAGLAFLANEQVPQGDGGVAYGQAAVAAARHDGDR